MSALLRSKNAAYVQIVKEHQKRVLDYNIDDEYCTMAPRLEHELSIVEDALGSSSSSSSSSSLRLRTQHSYLSSEVTGSKLIIAPDSLFEHDGEWQTRRRRKGSPKAKNWWKFNPLSRFLKSSRKLINLPPTTSLPILVLIDMFAVSLMVPLLFQYYKAAGITSANQRELLSSLFSTAQIVGGLLMGVLSDAKLLQRRTILFLSFGGSAVSYALIVYGGIYALILSRVIVGLVKHTMTVSIAILTKHTTKEDRTKHMGRLSASSTFAWIAGPSTGALLFKYVDHRAPALLACAMFAFNVLLTAILLDGDDEEEDHEEEANLKLKSSEESDVDCEAGESDAMSLSSDSAQKNGSSRSVDSAPSNSKCTSILNNLQFCFSSRAMGAAVVTKLVATFVTKATNYSQLGSFYEDMYGLEPHQRGYISSYQQFLEFVVQSSCKLISSEEKIQQKKRFDGILTPNIIAHSSYQ